MDVVSRCCKVCLIAQSMILCNTNLKNARSHQRQERFNSVIDHTA